MPTLRMLANAAGPEYSLDMGHVYTGVPKALAEQFLPRRAMEVVEEYEENGKKVTRKRVIGMAGPYAEEVTGPLPTRGVRKFTKYKPPEIDDA